MAIELAIQDGLRKLAANGCYFAPVRHHSPACALALRSLIREVRPAVVLIEGPDDFDALIPLLLDPATQPPVAVLSQARQAAQEDAPLSGVRSAFYPFCDYSPEWVALHEGHAVGAQLAFIDRPWGCTADDEPGLDASEQLRSLISERHLAHSAYLQALAARSGCRDQDELWDHLFELRDADSLRDWRRLFADIFAYCAMARGSYETAVLEADGSLPRERHMAAHLRAWRTRTEGPMVVVTGGFHTIALQQMLEHDAPHAAQASSQAVGNWLIRYSFDRLDALNGYAAGMPAPAYYQAVWDSAKATGHGPALHDVAADILTRLARQTRELGLADQLSTADARAALLQAMRLADLRGHAGPGRQDLLDAVRSCFIKGAIDDGTRGLDADIRRYLRGSRLGDIPPSAGSPPLLEHARRLAQQMRVRLDDSQPRTVRLDLYRKQRHRARSRFLHLMAYLDTGLAQWQSGPDFVGGCSLDLLIEEWRVAWNPMVEARLIDLAAQGATLSAVAMARLREQQTQLLTQGQGRSAGQAASLLTRACLIGLHQQLPALMALISSLLDDDGKAASVVDCGHKLLQLWRGREPLGLQDHPSLRQLLLQAWRTALYLAPQLAHVKQEEEAGAIQSLLSMRTLQRALGQPGDGDGHHALWRRQLQSLASTPQTPGVSAAAAAILFIDGDWDVTQLAALLEAGFGPGALPADAVRALQGVMAAAPELLLTQARLRASVNAILSGWDEHTFVSFLPDLRQAFAALKPRETAELAEALTGAGPDNALATVHYDATETDLLAGAALQAALAEQLARDGLGGWLGIAGALHG
ncbi:MAG: hypothetical protein K2X55_28995 [Burkholderiaceae bacterium]|nr:hypothetical protein [Burkholderiaceae bacterium]